MLAENDCSQVRNHININRSLKVVVGFLRRHRL
jgi:hypothetical protein